MNDKFSHLIFIFLLLLVSFYYDYHNIVFKRPQSSHAWRQSDAASLALNYSREGMHFFQPRLHNLTSDEGTTGKAATSEIPILYYTVAFLYKIFGHYEFIYRFLNTLIFLTGLYYLFRGIKIFLRDNFWAVAIPLFIFTSPVLAYYGNNFLSNTTALSMVFIAWYFVFRYRESNKSSDLLRIFLFFFLAGALKITALLSFFALAAIFIMEYIFRVNFENGKKMFPSPLHTLTGGILLLIPVIGWIVYASRYNQLHNTTYFSATLFPLWSLNPAGIRNVVDGIKEVWLAEYFQGYSLILLAIMISGIFIFHKRNRKFLIFILLFLLIEIIIYIVLQFWTFRDHDYYTINLYILPVFILLAFAELLKSLRMKRKLTLVIKIAFSVLVVLNIHYSKNRLNQRYEGFMNNNYRQMADFYSVSPHLREIGILPGDRVISFSDFSHVSLYLMDQKGWTRYIDMKFNRGKPYPYNQDSEGIKKSLKNKAKYLIINGFEDLYNNNFLLPFTQHLKSSYKNIMIFEPGNPVKNFIPSDRKLNYEVFCSAENYDSSGKYFVDRGGKYIFENANTRSEETSFSGSSSVRLNNDMPYGMTFRIKNLEHGESVKVSVWKNSEDNPGMIAVQAEEYQLFHKESQKLTGRKKGNWVEMEMDFFIPYEMKQKEIKIFLYNPERDEVFFDDLRICRYHSILQ